MNKIDVVKTPVYSDGVLYGYDLDILVDGEIPSTDVFDPIEFLAATFKRQKTFMFTCSCGVPGCSNIFKGIHVKYRGHTVEWRDMDSPYTMSQRFYSFDKNEYKATQAKCMGLMFEIIRENDEIKKEILLGDDGTNEYFEMQISRYTFCDYRSDSDLIAAIKYRQEWLEDYCLL